MTYLIALAILAPFVFSPLGIDLLYLRKDNTDKVIFTLRLLWGALKIPINVEKAQEKVEFDFSELFKKVDPAVFQRGAFLAMQLKGKVKCRALHLKIGFSLGDAALTGMASGFLWSSTGVILTLLKDYLKFKQAPALKITPAFKSSIFWEAYVFSRLEIKVVTALKVSFALFKFYLAKKWVQFWHRKAVYKLKMKEG
jgi:hypothetical protein